MHTIDLLGEASRAFDVASETSSLVTVLPDGAPAAPRMQENRHLVARDCAGAYDHAYAPPLTKGDSQWRGALPVAG